MKRILDMFIYMEKYKQTFGSLVLATVGLNSPKHPDKFAQLEKGSSG